MTTEPIKTTRPQDVPELRGQKLATAKRLIAPHVTVRICLGIAIVVPLASLYAVLQIVEAANAPMRGFTVDSADNFIVGPLRDVNQTTAHEAIARLATRGLLMRTPKGVDDPDLIERLFYGAAKTKAEADIKAQLPNLVERKMHQKVEISADIKVIATKGDSKSVLITGQLIRAGSFNGYAQNEAEPFAFIIAIAPNPKLGERGQYPYVVFDYKLAVGKERVSKIMQRDE